MREIEIKVTGSSDSIPQIVERICLLEGLTLTIKGTLASYPGCVHWHFKNGRAPGTLELTWWAQKNRLWFKVSTGREGPWMDAAMKKLQTQIEQKMQHG